MSILSRPRIAAVAAVAAVALVPAGTTATALPTRAHTAALTNVTFQTGFMPDVLFTPYYVAQDLGYYKKAGLNVTIGYATPPNLAESVASGQYTFASSDGPTSIIGAAAGAKIEYVMAQYQQYPVGAMWLKKGGPTITKPADLKGLKIGISAPGSGTDIGLDALLHAAGLTTNDVKVISIGFTETQALISHQVDVAMTYTDNEPVQAEAMGYPVNTLKVANYVKLTSDGVITSTAEAKNHPAIVEAFVKATLEGEAYTLAHPSLALKSALKRMPTVTSASGIALQAKILAARLAYQQPPAGHPLGWSDPSGWTVTTNFLKTISLIKTKPNPASLFTNSFITQADVHATG